MRLTAAVCSPDQMRLWLQCMAGLNSIKSEQRQPLQQLTQTHGMEPDSSHLKALCISYARNARCIFKVISLYSARTKSFYHHILHATPQHLHRQHRYQWAIQAAYYCHSLFCPVHMCKGFCALLSFIWVIAHTSVANYSTWPTCAFQDTVTR